MGLDAAMANTGWSVWSVSTSLQEGVALPTLACRLLKFGTIRTEPNLTVIERCHRIVIELSHTVKKMGVRHTVIEKPEEIVMGVSSGNSFNRNMAQVSGAIKLFSAIFTIIGSWHAQGFPIDTLRPGDWQERAKKNKSKEKSINAANVLLAHYQFPRRFDPKKENRDSHEADSINLSMQYIKESLHQISATSWDETVENI